MKALLPVVIALLIAGTAFAEQNLIPNGDFSAKDELKGWRIDFPYQSQYADNVHYCRVTTQLGRKCLARRRGQGRDLAAAREEGGDGAVERADLDPRRRAVCAIAAGDEFPVRRESGENVNHAGVLLPDR